MASRIKKDIVFSSQYTDKTQGLARLHQQINSLTGPLKRVNSQMGSLSHKMNQFGKNSWQRMRGQLGWGSVVSGIGGFLSLQSAGEYEQEVYRINEVIEKAVNSINAKGEPIEIGVKMSDSDLEQLKAKARELGKSTQFNPTEVLQGMKFLGTSGWKQQSILASIESVMKLTGAAKINSEIELPEVAEKFSDIASSFDVPMQDIKKFGDQIALTFSKSNQTFGQLMEAMKVFAPIAKEAGISYEEALATTMVLSDVGIKESLLGTALAGLTSRMLSPPKEAKDVIRKYFSEAEFNQLINPKTGMFNNKDDAFTQMFAKLKDKGLKPGELMKLFGQEAGKHVIAAVRKSGDLSDKLKLIRDENEWKDTAQRLNDTNIKGFFGQLRLLQSAIYDFAITLGESGLLNIFTQLTKAATKVVEIIGKIPKGLLEPITYVIAGLGSVFTGMFVVQIFKRAAEFAKVTAVLSKFALSKVGVMPFQHAASFLNVFVFLERTLLKMLAPIFSIKGLIVAIIGAFVYIGWFVWKNWDTLKAKFPVLEEMRQGIEAFFKKLGEIFSAVWKGINQAFSFLGEKFAAFFGDDFKFNPFADEEPKPSPHANLEKAKKESESKLTKKEKSEVKVVMDFRNVPRSTNLRVDNPDRTPLDTFTGFAWEGI